jgi:acid phosphatase (class A)
MGSVRIDRETVKEHKMNRRIKTIASTLFVGILFSCFSSKTYFPGSEIDLVKLLPPSPAQNSDQTKNDIDEMLELQKKRMPGDSAYAAADQDPDVFRFSTLLGPKFNKDSLPITAAFFTKVINNAKVIVDPVKEFWKRPRPSRFDRRIHPCIEVPQSGSFPSGHSTIGNLCAILLANMLEENRAEIFKRGWDYARNRVIGGVHYPSDVDAGRIAATVIAAALFRNGDFKNDFNASKAEVRKVLGLGSGAK